MITDNLQELTGHESGAIQYDGSDEIMILNWSSYTGLPRLFGWSYIGLGELINGKTCAVPRDVKIAMQQHELDQGAKIANKTGFAAWRVNDCATVVTQYYWA